jgi:tetratricopeptide (TPR) repeat protein
VSPTPTWQKLREGLEDERVCVALVALVGALVYANSLQNGFAYDDMYIVVQNVGLRSWSALLEALAEPYWRVYYGEEMGLWRPTTTGILGIQYIVGGGQPLLFRVVAVAGHAVAGVLVLLLLRGLMPALAALAGALVFAVHPVHVEAVANVVGQAEIFSTVAVLSACLIHVRSGPVSGWGSALAIGALYGLAFGAKESAVTLPGLVFVLDAARGRLAPHDVPSYLRDRWRAYLVMLLVAAALLVGRYAVLGRIANPLPPLGADLLAEIPRIWTLGEIWTHYVRLWVFPLDLSSDYSPNLLPVSLGWHATNVLGVVLALLVLTLALVAWRKGELTPDSLGGRAAAFGVVWFVVAISPVSNALFLTGQLLAERTLYLPSVGLAAATGWLVMRLARDRPRAAWVGLVLAVSLASARTWTRSPTWRDNPTLFTTLLAEHPQSGRSQWILGDAHLRQNRLPEAMLAYRVAIDLLGPNYQLLTEIGTKLVNVQRFRAAEVLLRQALAEQPRFGLAPSLLAYVRAEHGDAVGTERYARMSLARAPDDVTRHYMLAWALAAQGRWAEARGARTRAEELAPSTIWQRYVHDAWSSAHGGDTSAARVMADSALSAAFTSVGRAFVDSVRVADFGLAPKLGAADSAGLAERD